MRMRRTRASHYGRVYESVGGNGCAWQRLRTYLRNRCVSMRWFGFGFNAFEQICVHGKVKQDEGSDVKVTCPTELQSHVETSSCCLKRTRDIKTSWSRTVSLHLDGGNSVCLTGFKTATSVEFSGCTDAVISEHHLTIAFPGRVEVWDIQKKESVPKWSMNTNTQPEICDLTLKLPLVPGGYIGDKPPFYRSLSPSLKAKSLALGAEHALLLCATGDVYTWGLGSHGQLGHGGLSSEEEPRAVEALWGMPMSSVATGGWHSACISDGGDLYVWGWNESGQLGLPSQGVRKSLLQNQRVQGASGQDIKTNSEEVLQEVEKLKECFISIQAFPALLDVTPSCEIKAVSCGSRHTAAVTTTGDLYTWGWGEYGQLGHQNLTSLDEPQPVEFFKKQRLRVVEVACGTWSTFAAVIKEELSCS